MKSEENERKAECNEPWVMSKNQKEENNLRNVQRKKNIINVILYLWVGSSYFYISQPSFCYK